MEAELSNSELGSQLSTVLDNSAANLHKAWHLLSLILTSRRPIRLTEFASRCKFFRLTPDIIEFLCSIPNSPVLLNSDRSVSISWTAFVAFREFLWNLSNVSAFVPRSIRFIETKTKRSLENVSKTYFRKRKRNVAGFQFSPVAADVGAFGEKYLTVLDLSDGTQTECAKVKRSRSPLMQLEYSSNMTPNSDKLHKVTVNSNVFFESNASPVNCVLKSDGEGSKRGEDHGCINTSDCQYVSENHENCMHVPDAKTEMVDTGISCQESSVFLSTMVNRAVLVEAMMSLPYSMHGTNLNEPFMPKVEKKMIVPPGEIADMLYDCRSPVKFVVDEIFREGREGKDINDSIRLPFNTTNIDMPFPNFAKRNTIFGRNEIFPFNDTENVTNQLENSLLKLKTVQQDAITTRPEATDFETLENCKANGMHVEQQQCKRKSRLISTKQKLKQNYVEKRHSKGKREKSIETSGKPSSTFLKNQVQPKSLPNFEFFTVEEEEGSGGYGTVYRAKRKHDGVTLAVKCPHGNANRHHIENEQKMLEQFGGKNFVIKYEGSFKYGSADCLVLQHVEHERPEVLKKEIDLFQLQWYGYCLFRALACLHKQGVVHRDVKPGNFLFSRMVNKGYLIDFNLALDMYKKYGTTDESAMSYSTGLKHVPLPYVNSNPPAKARKVLTANALVASNQEAERGSKSVTLTKNFKRKTDQTKLHEGYRTKISQGADGSGITSAKDATSTKVLSGERLREPVPCQGRKELISLAQEAMHGPNHEVAIPPTSKRKRIAAPPERVDSKIIYLTPMPLHSSGVAIAGAGFIKRKGEVKNKKEGPCVGTKGFRAPEVLLKSPFQGPKIDVWSAGVTLVYLSTGRSPFVGDPDQNIKDIAKLRGSEDLWEVAKLHNRESSFPVRLLDVPYLPSKKLCDWFGLNTKRPDLLKDLPRSFFDLVDKCLTVNPRLRISAEDALRHEFFAPCHEQLEQQRLRRQGRTLLGYST